MLPMMGQAASVFVVSPFTQKVEHLRKCKGHDKVVGGVYIAYQKEQGRFIVPELVKLQLVIAHNLPKLRYVKGGQPGSTANQNRLGCFARDKLSRTFLPIVQGDTVSVDVVTALMHSPPLSSVLAVIPHGDRFRLIVLHK